MEVYLYTGAVVIGEEERQKDQVFFPMTIK